MNFIHAIISYIFITMIVHSFSTYTHKKNRREKLHFYIEIKDKEEHMYTRSSRGDCLKWNE